MARESFSDEEIEAIITSTRVPNDISSSADMVAMEILFEVSHQFISRVSGIVGLLRRKPGNEEANVLELLGQALRVLNLGEDHDPDDKTAR